MSELSKAYAPADVEASWYARWVDSGCFTADPSSTAPSYSIVIPPPNVTGILTLGHVLNNTLQDILARRARQTGHEVLWLPGTDHAGIATQTVVERQLRKEEKKTRHDLGREAFLKKVWEWKEKHGGIIIGQLKKLGASCDWSRERFTMDEAYARKVQEVFVDLHGKGLIYRGKRMVNWCPVSLTALSDEEVIPKKQKGYLYHFKLEVVEAPGTWLEIATTRPETIMGDTAVAVNPKDQRYAHLIGKHVRRPLPLDVEVQLPIIGDEAVDFEFGTGVLKVTPAHDKTDYEIGLRHNLPVIDIMNADGTLNDLAGEGFAGLDRFEARVEAVERLKELGLLTREEPHENNVGFSERADVPIEPRLSEQWFLKYPKTVEARDAVRNGLIRFFPKRWEKVYDHWLENIQDWCISRQLWWGHRIPVWYRKGIDRERLTEADLADPTKVHVSLDGPSDPQNWEQEEDVLDTWASSWLWPFATLGWPDRAAMNAAGYDRFYPTTTLATGADIIFFWVARMIMAGLEFTGDELRAAPGAAVRRPTAPEAPRSREELARRIPFRHVYFNGIVRDKSGRKMSKTLGNSPDPLDLIAKYGADGLRFGLLQIAPLGQDVKFDEDRIEGGKNFCNKVWNAARFRQMSGPMADNRSLDAILARIQPARLDDDDHALLAALGDTLRVVERGFDEFEFAGATQRLYSFFWNDFCDWYVEVAKARLQDPAAQAHVLAMQDLVIREFLLMFAPFAPFITEELWHLLGYGAEGTFLQDARIERATDLVERLGAVGVRIDAESSRRVETLKQVASLARQLKAEQSVAQKRDVTFLALMGDAEWSVVQAASGKLARLVGAAVIQRTADKPAFPAVVTPLGTLFLDTGIRVDPAAEKTRLQKELEQISKHIAGTEARLSNEAFVSKAPPAVLDGARRQLADQQAKRAEIERLLAAL